jgi:hypothetical protein
VHWVATKHVLRYLCGTIDYGLNYQRGDGVRLVGYTDSDWEGCVVTGRVLLGVVSDWAQ